MPYDMSLLQNQTGFLGPIIAANTYTGGLFFLIIIVIIGASLFFALRGQNRNRESFAATMFILTILSGLLTLMGLLDTKLFGGCVILTILSVVFLINKK